MFLFSLSSSACPSFLDLLQQSRELPEFLSVPIKTSQNSSKGLHMAQNLKKLTQASVYFCQDHLYSICFEGLFNGYVKKKTTGK